VGSAYIALPFSKKLPTIPRSTFSVSQADENPEDPYTPVEALPTTVAPREKPMGFWEHLEELRGTIVKSLVVFIIFAVLIGFFAVEFNKALLWPLHYVAKDYPDLSTKLGTLSIMEVFNMVIQMCVFGGLMLAAPFILFFIGQFVAPALTEREMKAVLPLCFSALVLFIVGAAFAFFLLMPSTIKVAIELNNAFELENRWTAGNYFTTLTWLVIGSGGVFEFPLVIILLVWLGIMSTAFLRKYRRHAIVVIFIIAAIVTPTPDPFTQSLFAAPLYALYEIAIVVSARVEKKRERAARFG
jgi:sec-independent protein translocase protein TatC